MTERYQFKRQIAFAETDMAGIMHFANFFRLMEEAEHAFFRSLGTSVHPVGERKTGWPRVHASCDFRKPLRFEDWVTVVLEIEELRAKSIHYHFRFLKEIGDGDSELVAEGSVKTVYVVFHAEEGTMQAESIPDAMRALIAGNAGSLHES